MLRSKTEETPKRNSLIMCHTKLIKEIIAQVMKVAKRDVDKVL